MGAALVDGGSLDDVMARIVPGDLVDEGCRKALTVMISLQEDDLPVSAQTVATRLDLDPAIAGGGRQLVTTLIGEAAGRAALRDMIEDVRGCAAARISGQVARLLGQAADGSGGAPRVVRAAVDQAMETLSALTQEDGEEDWAPAGDVVTELLTQGPQEPMCDTGMPDLDDLLGGGLRAGQLIVVAARPAMGKSTFAFDLCRHASVERNVPSVYVSLEMGRRELGLRLLAAEAGVDMRTLQGDLSRLDERDRDAVHVAHQRLAGAPLEVVDPVDATWAAVSAHVRAAHRRAGGGPMVAVIDYLGLVALEAKGGETSRQNGLQEVSRRCKQMAKALGIVVILVSQLNRGPELRTDHRPMMADLRETGSLEQDADVVVLLYRPDYYEITERPGEADVIVAKQRNGSTGTVPMVFQGHYSRFRPLAKML